jgi:hypothetical protein
MIQCAREKEINRNNKKEGKMLSHKLKHLCSHVIASLSAFGLIQITSGKSHAKTLDYQFKNAMPGDTFVYNATQDTTFYAEFSESCSLFLSDGTSGYIASAAYSGEIPGASGKVGCKFTCKDGYVFASSNSATGIVTGTAGSTIFPTEACVIKQETVCTIPEGDAYTGIASANTTGYSGSTSSSTGDGSIANGTTGCVWTCKQGFTASSNPSVYVGSFSGGWGTTGAVSPNGIGSCQPRSFTLSFNCAPGHFAESENTTTSGYAVTYGKSVTIPTWAQCERDGYNFTGWSGNAY